MRLRQIAFVAADLEPAVEDLCEVLGIEVGYRDPGVEAFGLVNAVMPMGDTFLEVVSPDRPGTTAGRLLERRQGDGGYMVIVQTEELDGDRKRVEELGVRIVWEVTLDDAAAIHLHPRDVGGAILSLDAMQPPESWRWAGPRWREHVRGDVTSSIVGAELQMSDPEATARRWSHVLNRPAAPRDDGAHEIALDAGRIRFVPHADDRGDGLSGLLVSAPDPERVRSAAAARGRLNAAGDVELCGVRIELSRG